MRWISAGGATRHHGSVLTFAMALGACAGIHRAPPPRTLMLAPPGDLPQAAPFRDDLTNRGQTGSPSRVALGARREQVRELFDRFVRAMRERSVAQMRPLFADPVYGMDSGNPFPRETVLAYQERLLQFVDTTQLADALSAEPPVVRSFADYRREGRAPPAAMRPGDWVVTRPPLPHGTALSAYDLLPRAFLVRFIDEQPSIVGLPDGQMFRAR